MEDWNSFGVVRPSISSSNNNEEFEEEEVLWKSINNNGHYANKDDHQDRPKHRSAKNKKLSPSSSSATTIPKKALRRAFNNNSDDTQASSKQVGHLSSAPMKIPDWSKIYGKNRDHRDDDDGDRINSNDGYHDNEDGEDDMVPPHEWIARKLARSQISSFSVCEGIGRTLKGRDLSKVRNAILTKTGFLE